MLDGLDYYDTNIPCLAACPVHTNAGAYVAAIADGDDLSAYLTARLPNPFASVCGRVCAAPCEAACRRGQVDTPIAIRALKRFVTEKYGAEAGVHSRWADQAGGPVEERAQSVGIVGGGPAGLAAAHDLRLQGYQVTVYEATDRLGGMMVLGIPAYRLDRGLLGAEIDAIVDLGVDVRLTTKLGSDVTLEGLRADHDAVFLALGATLGRGLDIPGADADGVFRAIEFLINLNLGFTVEVGRKVVVVGGGNVAMDAARTALRVHDVEEEGPGDHPLRAAMDVARTAVRSGATDVTVVALESRAEMPADDFEIEEAIEEGIRFIHRRGPDHVVTRDGKAVGLATVGVTSVFDPDGRFNPQYDRADEAILDADTVVLAIGQAVDLAALGAAGPETQRGTITVDPETGATSLPFVWSGGDAAHGPRLLIDAIADGRRVASRIHEALSGTAPVGGPEGRMVTARHWQRLPDPYDLFDRTPVPSLPSDRRIGITEVELGFTEAEARREASRCLRCFANIELDVNSCVLCALCVDVCPYGLISLVPSGNGSHSSMLLLDESMCIRCALCIDRCPPDALSMGIWLRDNSSNNAVREEVGV